MIWRFSLLGKVSSCATEFLGKVAFMRRREWDEGRWEKIEIKLIKEPIEESEEFYRKDFMGRPSFSAKKAFRGSLMEGWEVDC
jgi:hypothetical protein